MPPSVSSEIVRSALRLNLPFIAIASIVFAAALASIVLFRLRSRDPLLLWLGIFALLYSVRLFLQNELIHDLALTGAPPFRLWALCLTYVMAIPFVAFARELLGAGWRKSIVVWLWVQVIFAPVAILAATVAHQLRWTNLANNILIIAGTLLILCHVFLTRSPESASITGMKWPLVIFAALVLCNNLGLRSARFDLEPLGFLTLLAGLGYTAALRAVGRERKLTEVEQELATARHIQASILPRSSPHFSELQIATRYEPMSAVAGDFYDFLKTSDHCLTVLVADVSGHGVPAALVASMLKICLAAQRDRAADPARLLGGFNGMLRDVLAGQYVTAACAFIDLQAETVTYSGAGHPPALLIRKNAVDVVHLSENGLFIGPFPGATYNNICVPFGSGDKLLIYTDGIIEATVSDGEQFGRERLIQFLLDTRHLEPADLIQQLFARISSSRQEDDLTAVLVQMS